MGENQGNFDPEMILIDHDVQCFPGSSRAPIINMAGEVIGMDFSQLTMTEHNFCVSDHSRQSVIADYYKEGKWPQQQIKELQFLTCNVKQAII
jgi:S1-C subfamily serine protease